AGGEPGASTLYARYQISNRADRGEPVRLYVAIRPFQVNPPWQTLNVSGGVTHIRSMRFDGRVVWVDRDRAVVSLTLPDHFGAAPFEAGSVTRFLAADRVPPHTEVTDPLGFASGALQYNLYLEPKGRAEVDLAVPFHDVAPTAARLIAADGAAYVAEQQEPSRSTTATPATWASSTTCGRTCCAPSTTWRRCGRRARATTSRRRTRPCSTASCPPRSATRATRGTRSTPTGTTSSRCAA